MLMRKAVRSAELSTGKGRQRLGVLQLRLAAEGRTSIATDPTGRCCQEVGAAGAGSLES